MRLTLSRRATSAFLLLTAFVLPASVHAADAAPVARVTEATAERTSNSTYRLTWTTDPAETTVSIYVSNQPNAERALMHRLAESVTGGRYKAVAMPDSIARPYFLIQPEGGGGKGMWTATRVLPLEGGRNFRDLGGYPGADGKRTKWGTIFRSGVLSGLTDADYDYLSNLGVEVVCDFRSSEERTRETTNWRGGPAPKIIAWGYASSGGEEMSAFFEGEATAERMRGMMTKMYGQIAYRHARKYATMFRRLAAGELPLLFHCSAGKDRAGTGAALLLTALGVPREVVVRDYAMSENVVDYEAAYREELKRAAEEGGPMAALAKLSPDVRAPLFRSDPAYIRAAFAELEENHGSVEGFIKEVMGIEERTLLKMRARLLE